MQGARRELIDCTTMVSVGYLPGISTIEVRIVDNIFETRIDQTESEVVSARSASFN